MTSAQTNGQDANKEIYGTQLSAARLRRGLTVQQVAKQLNLPTERIDEIESGEFNQAISSTFYRGYIRSYAQLMKLNDSEVLAGFNGALADSVELRSLGSIGGADAAARREVNTRSSVFKWVTGIIVAGIVVAAIWGIKERFIDGKNSSEIPTGEISSELFSDNSETANIDQTNTGISHKVDINDAAVTLGDNSASTGTEINGRIELNETIPNSAAINAPEIVESTGVVFAENNSEVDSSSEVINVETNDNTPVSTSNQNTVSNTSSVQLSASSNLQTLTFVFTGDCWVEVSDARGERLAFGLIKSGRVMSVDGVAPFSVLLGDASVVQLKHGDQSVNLNAYRPGQTANLTLQ